MTRVFLDGCDPAARIEKLGRIGWKYGWPKRAEKERAIKALDDFATT